MALRSVDLMIGDWVYNKYIDKPMQVYPMMLSQMFRSNPDATAEDYNIFPIPLTPEILEKNGFETKDNAHYYSAGKIIELLLEEHPFIGYSIHWVKTIETINPIGRQCFLDYYIANLEYVHELQHALRLCGIDKEIVL